MTDANGYVVRGKDNDGDAWAVDDKASVSGWRAYTAAAERRDAATLYATPDEAAGAAAKFRERFADVVILAVAEDGTETPLLSHEAALAVLARVRDEAQFAQDHKRGGGMSVGGPPLLAGLPPSALRGVFPGGHPLAYETATADRWAWAAERFRVLDDCTDVALYRVHNDGFEERLPSYEEALASRDAIARQRDSMQAEREAERKAWTRLLDAERAHHDHTLLLSETERDDDMKGPRAAVVEAEEALRALGVDPEEGAATATVGALTGSDATLAKILLAYHSGDKAALDKAFHDACLIGSGKDEFGVSPIGQALLDRARKEGLL